MDFFSGLLTFFGKGQQRYIPRSADGSRQVTLMPVTCPGDATGNNLAALRQIIPEEGNVLVIDVSHFIRAESAELSSLKKSLSFQTFLLYVATENFSLSLTREIFDPTKAQSLESANSAFGVKQCPFATLWTLPLPRWVPKNFAMLAQGTFSV